MFKTILIIVMATLCLNFNSRAQSQKPLSLTNKQAILGKVVSSTTGEALSEAVIKVTAPSHTTVSNDKGEFILTLSNGTYNLSISHLGYKTKTVSIQIPLKEPLIIALDNVDKNLQEVEIVSTGYQNIPKERATGSFTIINNELLNRTVSPDLLSRLNGVTNGLLFDSSTANPLGISIRGKSTLHSNMQPLIIVDNFPFEGDLNTLNPNDIETVTILKDAAAAAIWGTRAGNGVLVITTKKGKFNKTPVISINANTTIVSKPNLYQEKQLTSSEYIDIEKFLFDKGKYNSTINNGYTTISPVIAILQKQKLNQLTVQEANAQIDQFRILDVRDQIDNYYYRPQMSQQYHFNVAGGSSNQNYFISGGYDKTQATIVGQSNSRFTLNGSNNFKVWNDKLTLSTNLSLSSAKNESTGTAYSPYLPYDQLVDNNGSALSVLRSNGLRESFTDTVGNGKLLDWKYRPLEELNNKYNVRNDDETTYRLNLAANYVLFSPLTLSINYQYLKASGLNEAYSSLESYITRNLINSPSYIDPITGKIIRPIPLGATLNTANRSRISNAGRAQLNFNKRFKDEHDVNAIAGYEVREDRSQSNSNSLYGYNKDRASSIPVDQTSEFPNLYGSGSSTVTKGTQSWNLDRNISYYVNASYGYKNRYILSGSIRKDESNLFGVKANQKGVPLWSAGLLWNLHHETFLKSDWIENLKLRVTYGYNGNVNKNITAYLTAAEQPYTNSYGQNFAMIQNPPNDALKWERVRNMNLGIDFQLKDNRISGSVDYYIKSGMDLIGSSPIPPQTGISTFTGNVANTKTQGIDIQINTINIDRLFKWKTTVIYNFNKNIITNYEPYAGNNEFIVSTVGINPIVGYPINALFAYKWTGLNENGDPKGLFNGAESIDYTNIRNTTDYNELNYFGSSAPTHYGSIRNTLSYRYIELSFNIVYKLGYFLRRNSLNYSSLFNGSWKQPDFDKRWQVKGDELLTNVPSMIYPANSSRESFYKGSAVLVEKGDHFRLRDIQLNFNLTKKEIRQLPLSNLAVYAYANNLPLLWKASKNLPDPEVSSGYPAPFSIAFGIKTNL